MSIHNDIFTKNFFIWKNETQNIISYNLYDLIGKFNNKEYSECNYRNQKLIHNNYISPYKFKYNFGKLHQIFKSSEQQDAAEFIRVLLKDLSKENNINTNIYEYKELDYTNKNMKESSLEFHNAFIKKENSFVVNNFYTQNINIFTCECNSETYAFENG